MGVRLEGKLEVKDKVRSLNRSRSMSGGVPWGEGGGLHRGGA